MERKYRTCLVVGSGAFGTSIACLLAEKFETVILKIRTPEQYQEFKTGKNSKYLPGLNMPANLRPALEWSEIDQVGREDIDLVASGLPSSSIKPFFSANHQRFESYLEKGIPFLGLSKGIDPVTLELCDDLYFDLFPKHKELFTFLSGPSFAREIVEKQITLVSLAGKNLESLLTVSRMLETSYFKAFNTYDIKGVLLGGALKNILAIAAGILEGLGLNHNTRAALITRGIYEMLRFGKVFNARQETFYGLSGMGDLILTTTGNLSRNRYFGLEIAKGRSPEQILEEEKLVVEGHKTAKAAFLVAQKFKIRAPIFNGVYQVLYKKADPRDVIQNLMRIPAVFEVN